MAAGFALFLTGCSDDYDCASNDMFFSAMAIKGGYSADENGFYEYIDLLEKNIDNIKIDLTKMDDTNKRSYCTAYYSYKKDMSEEDFIKISKTITNTQSPLADAIFRRALSELKEVARQKNTTWQETINQQKLTYSAYDNGRGEIYIEVE